MVARLRRHSAGHGFRSGAPLVSYPRRGFTTAPPICGGKTLGYLVFEVPKASKMSAVQFGMDSGFADTGEWLAK